MLFGLGPCSVNFKDQSRELFTLTMIFIERSQDKCHKSLAVTKKKRTASVHLLYSQQVLLQTYCFPSLIMRNFRPTGRLLSFTDDLLTWSACEKGERNKQPGRCIHLTTAHNQTNERNQKIKRFIGSDAQTYP